MPLPRKTPKPAPSAPKQPLLGPLRLRRTRARAAEDRAARQRSKQGGNAFAPGHYYSPLPDLDEVRRNEARLFDSFPRQLPGIDMREAAQLALLERFALLYPDIPFDDQPRPGLRFHYKNPAYGHSDAIMLHCMLRTLQPRRLVEVGCGYSSCVTLDTNEHFLHGQLQTTFIEPFPDLLRSLIKPADAAGSTILAQPLQEVDLDVFRQLGDNDVLFVDSTHVGKIGSDVNRLLFEVFPVLAPGVVIHLHDIFFPFEYPKRWLYEGRAWNEAYLLRAFLQYNRSFEVLLMNSFMSRFHRPFFVRSMPLCLRNPGASLWLRKTG